MKVKIGFLLLMLLMVACAEKRSATDAPEKMSQSAEKIVLQAPPTMPAFDEERFTRAVDVDCSNPAPRSLDGAGIQVDNNIITINVTKPGVEIVLKGGAEGKSVVINSNDDVLLTLSSLSLTSYMNNAITVKSQAHTFVRCIGDNFVADGKEGEEVYAPKNCAAIRIEGDATFVGGDIRLRGERKSALHCSGKLYFADGNVVVSAARSSAILADSGVVVKGGNYRLCGNKDALRAKKGDVTLMGGNMNLTALDEKGAAIKAASLYVRGGNITIDVSAPASRGVNVKDTLFVLGGNMAVSAAGDAVFNEKKNDYSSGSCLKVGKFVYMQGGTVTLDNSGVGGKGVNCNGGMTVAGGAIKVVTTGMDIEHEYDAEAHASAKGIKCDSTILIAGGDIDVQVFGEGGRCEGIESKDKIVIEGNDTKVSVYAYDDALNAGTDFVMNDGLLFAYSAANDAIDSNGAIAINGGLVVANGAGSPEQGIDVDVEKNYTIAGGDVLSLGGTMGATPCMPRGVVAQPVVAVCGISVQQGEYLHVADEAGSVIASYLVPRTIDGALLISSPELAKGKSYYLLINDSAVEGGYLGNGYSNAGTIDVVNAVQFTITDDLMAVDGDGKAITLPAPRDGSMPPPPAGHFPPPPPGNRAITKFAPGELPFGGWK